MISMLWIPPLTPQCYLPFDSLLSSQAAKVWVQAQNWWKSEAEWWEWIASGEKDTFYIPSDPETYYERVGGWEGWDEFLGVQGC